MAARTVTGRKVRYGVVGGGWISQQAFMPGVGQTDNSEMTALITGDPEKADRLAKRYGLKSFSYDQFAECLASDAVDALYVATPNFRHTEFVVPALEAGVHVLLEKPMATSEADCRLMIEAAERSGARLMIAYRLHFEPATVEAFTRIRSGEFGAPRIFSSTFGQYIKASNHRASSGYWAGPVADLGPYPINAARHFFGKEPIEVRAIGARTRDLGFDDIVQVALKFGPGEIAQFTLDYSGPAYNDYRLIGTKGDIHMQPGYAFGAASGLGYTATLGGDIRRHNHPITDQFGGETAYFSSCIIEGRDPEPDGEDGMLDVRVIAAIERALSTGETQSLEPLARRKHIQADQAYTLPLAPMPDMINGEPPA
ncbi:Predicted dehydrogenase [Arboricoccus pini]|uniref:Predicted dehydrogenase n=1 Tax=Arboricoccus pini TaxID=1963835 RepID=A0A212R5J7_9PROT|nr:Gfo/Idh/MocA family oxidoreductase [Arboricoccus pini]SNB67246.1 Predicted dehydrogenase [Arboricoccus pini]